MFKIDCFVVVITEFHQYYDLLTNFHDSYLHYLKDSLFSLIRIIINVHYLSKTEINNQVEIENINVR